MECFVFVCVIMTNSAPQRASTCLFLSLWGATVLAVVLVVLLGGEIGDGEAVCCCISCSPVRTML